MERKSLETTETEDMYISLNMYSHYLFKLETANNETRGSLKLGTSI